MALTDEIYMDEKVEDYIVDVVQATRTPEQYGLDVGSLILKGIGMDVLRHRVIITYEAEAEEKTSEDVVSAIFDNVAVP